MQVFILCGGLGTRMREETEVRPKPMVDVGGQPLLWHVMQSYARHGFDEFVLMLGYKGDVIRRHFLDRHLFARDFTVTLGTGGAIEAHGHAADADWKVTLAETGNDAMTGARIARAAGKHLRGDRFLCTYGDGVSDVDLRGLVAFHAAHGRIGTVTGVHPPARFGTLTLDGDAVTRFAEKPVTEGWINGGFFVFERAFLPYLSADSSCVLEKDPLERLATDGQLRVFRHGGFWQCVDTLRDLQHLQELVKQQKAPWLG